MVLLFDSNRDQPFASKTSKLSKLNPSKINLEIDEDKENAHQESGIIPYASLNDASPSLGRPHLVTEGTIKVQESKAIEPIPDNEGVQKKLNFSNCDNELPEKVKIVKIQRYLFSTDLWFTGLGMTLQELCDPKDPVILQGELYRYKPGLDRVYISRWCQLTSKVFRVYRNQMAAKGFPDKPILALPLYTIKGVKRSKFKVATQGKNEKVNRGHNVGVDRGLYSSTNN